MPQTRPYDHYESALDRLRSDLRDDAEMFYLAPVSLWLEDFSAVRSLFEEWRGAGVTDLRRHLMADRSRIAECSSRISVIKVNAATLKLFEAATLDALVAELDMVFRDEMLENHVEELVHLWNGD